MKYSHIICHYSEIGLKGKNRPFFVKTLQKNIRYAVNQSIPELVKDVEKTHDRLIISLNEGVKESYDLLFNTLKEVFGIAYFCPVFLIDNDLDSMKSNAINILKNEDVNAFRVTARMSKSVSLYSKMYVHEHIGLFIQSEMKKDVNLKHPDITCY
ncbi:MAG TPA: THUMP domain-containing protein, partial [Candidatus Marinimicrobia bacterium]|nr:THUMP domain-containing protein [Candidatus Neomarinimicrobiota bacterium]